MPFDHQAMMQLQSVLEAHKATMKTLGQCFGRCVSTPGSSLSSYEQNCIANCTRRIIQTDEFLARYVSRRVPVETLVCLICLVFVCRLRRLQGLAESQAAAAGGGQWG